MSGFHIAAVIIAIIGVLFILHNLWQNWKINRITSWPTADAYVIFSGAQPANNAAGNVVVDPRTIVPNPSSSAQYSPVVEYRYNVGNRDYTSGGFMYDSNYAYNSVDTLKFMNQIVSGSTIKVYYNPNNYSESYIYSGQTKWMGTWFGIILLIVAAILAAVGKKRAGKTKAR